MKPMPPVVRTLDASVYTKIAGELRKNLPGKVIIDIDRGRNEKGQSIVHLRCKYPEVAKRVIASVLGEEYVEPEIEDMPEKRPTRQWWQRSIDSGIGGGRSRDPSSLRRSADMYAKNFQADLERTRKRMYKATQRYEDDIQEGVQGFKRRGKFRI